MKETQLTKRGEKAFELETKIKDLKYQVGANFIEMGKTLKEIRDKKYYVELGFDSVTLWLNSPDISISRSWAFDFISIYEELIVARKVPQARLLDTDYTKLREVASILKKNPEEDTEKWLEKAETLRRVDLKREIQEFRGVSEQDVADETTAHIRVKQILDWISLLKRNETSTVIEELEGEVRKATGLYDLSKVKGDRL